MITIDNAFAAAREALAHDIGLGGLVTLYGFSEHWIANCTFPNGDNLNKAQRRSFKISRVDGSVTEIA